MVREKEHQKYKVLIVEDEGITAMYMQQQLKGYNFNVIKPVGTGEKAIKVAQEEKPEVILMDIRLASKMSGIEAAREILSFSDAYIIFMTGYLDDKYKIEAEALNALYIIKPVHIKKIVDVIDEKYSIN